MVNLHANEHPTYTTLLSTQGCFVWSFFFVLKVKTLIYSINAKSVLSGMHVLWVLKLKNSLLTLSSDIITGTRNAARPRDGLAAVAFEEWTETRLGH